MKRTYSDMASALTSLPRFKSDDPSNFKSTLAGTLKLRVVKVVDISKPTDKPIEDIDAHENEEANRETNLSKGNARMIQLDLEDANDVKIRAVETEHIAALNNIKPNCLIEIIGPIDLRCGNLMLEKRHDIRVEKGPAASAQEQQVQVPDASWPSDEEDDIIISAPPASSSASTSNKKDAQPTPGRADKTPNNDTVTVVDLDEDDWDEDEDDCIILD